MPRNNLSFGALISVAAILGAVVYWMGGSASDQGFVGGPVPLEMASSASLNLGEGPLLFEQNVGQAPRGASYVARGGGLTLLASPERIAFSAPVGERPARAPERPGIDRPQPDPRPHALVSMEFLGANPAAEASSANLRGRVNYAIPPDSSGVVERDAARFERVRFEEVYPGIDLELYGVNRGMEYDFVVRPGADPAAIRLGFRNVDGVRLNGSGELLMQTVAGEIRQSAPTVYQLNGDRRALIDARFEEVEPGEFLLALADYDRAKPLIIDPVIHFSGGFGGSGDDPFRDIASDDEGNLYVAGFTNQPNWLMGSASLSELLDEGPIPQQVGGSYGFLLKLMKNEAGGYEIANSLMVANTQYAAVKINEGAICVVGTAQPGAPPPDRQIGPGGRFDARLTCVSRDFGESAHLGFGGFSDDFGAVLESWRDGSFLAAMDISSDPADIPECASADFNRDHYNGNGQTGFTNSYNWTLSTLEVFPDFANGAFDVSNCAGHLVFGEGTVGGTSWIKADPDRNTYFVGGATNAQFLGSSNVTVSGGSAQRFFRPFNFRRQANGRSRGAFPNVGGTVNAFTGSAEIVGDFLLQGVQSFFDETRSTVRIYGSRWNTTQVSSEFLFGFPFGAPSGFNYVPRIKSIGYDLFYFGGSSNSVAGFEPPIMNAPANISSQNMVVGLSQMNPSSGAVTNLWTYMAGNSTTTSDQILLGLTCDDWHNPVVCGYTTGGGFPAVNGQSTFQGGNEDGIVTQFYNPFVSPNAVVMNGQFQNPGVLTPCGAVAVFGHLMPGSSTVGAPVDGAFPIRLNGYEASLFPGAPGKVQGQPIEIFGVFDNGQFNGMLPCDFPLGEASLQITEGAGTDEPLFSNPVPLNIVAAAPQWAVFFDAAGQNVACLNASNSNLLVTQANPAGPGDVLQCFFFGGGQSTPACQSIAPSDQLLTLDANLTVTLGTAAQNPPAFIAPGLTCALDQTNFTVKMDLTPAEMVPPADNEAGLWVQAGKSAVYTKLLISAQ